MREERGREKGEERGREREKGGKWERRKKCITCMSTVYIHIFYMYYNYTEHGTMYNSTCTQYNTYSILISTILYNTTLMPTIQYYIQYYTHAYNTVLYTIQYYNTIQCIIPSFFNCDACGLSEMISFRLTMLSCLNCLKIFISLRAVMGKPSLI